MAYRSRRYRRRRSVGGRQRLHPFAIVGICVAAAILVTLLIGNLLNRYLDDETLQRLEGVTPEALPEENAPERAVPYVRAYPFRLGSSTSSLGEGENGPPAALSISINDPSGTLTYVSDVSRLQGLTGNDRVPLKSSMEAIWQTVPYLSGVFYPQALNQSGHDAVYAATVAEGALLREFVRAGASEILLAGLPAEADRIPEVAAYVQTVSAMLGQVHVGIAVPLDVASAPESWELLPSLSGIADFLAIDLRTCTEEALEESLLSANYYIVQYRMRLLLSEEQTAYITAAEATVSDFQIVSRPQTNP